MEIEELDIVIGTRDSLKRQVIFIQLQEITKQIQNEKNKNQARDLMLRKKLENTTANHILNSLTLQKQLQEMKHLYQDSKKQMDIELQRLKISMEQSITNYHSNSLKKISTLTQIQEILNYNTLLHLDKQTASKVRESLGCLDEPSTNRMLYESIQSETYVFSEEGLLDDKLLQTLFTNRLKRILNGDASTERLASEAVTQNKLNNLKKMIAKFIQDLRNKESEIRYEEAGNLLRARSRKNTQIRLNKSVSSDSSNRDLTVLQYNCITSSSGLPHTDNSVLHIRPSYNTSTSFEKFSSELDPRDVEFSIVSLSSDQDVHQELISASNYSAVVPPKSRVNDSLAVEVTCLSPFQNSRRMNDTIEQRMYAECSEPASRLPSPNESSKFLRKKSAFKKSESSIKTKSWRSLICPCFSK